MNQIIIQLIVGYSLAAVFIFTAVVTALSLIGKVTFAVRKQQEKLFTVLVVQLAIGGAAFFKGYLQFDPKTASTQIARQEITAQKRNFEQKLQQARTEYEHTNLVAAYKIINELFRSPDLQEFFPIRDLFVLNGDISSKRNFWLEAAESYGPALRLDPNNISVLASAALAYRQLKRYEDAEQLYARAFAVEPQNWAILNGYFNCLQRYAAFLSDHYPKIADDKFQKAAVIADQMQQVANSKYEVRTSDVAKGIIFWQWKKYDIALEQSRKLVGKYPDESRFSEDLAAILMESGHVDEGYKLFAQLAERERKSGQISFFVGSGIAEAAVKANVGKPELEQALSASLLAVAADPKDPFGHYAVALVEWRLGRKAEAQKHLLDAINAEEKRSTNMHTYDRERHEQYIALKAEWDKTP